MAAAALCCRPTGNCSADNASCQPLVTSLGGFCETVTCFDAQVRPLGMAWLPWLVWTVAFCLMLIVAIGGNSVVCWIILAHRHMRTVTNYFLVNLSVANLLMSCLNCSFNFVYMLNADWPFGETYCVISNFMANLTVAASVLTLMAIALERYVVILHPLRRRLSKKGAVGGMVGIWTASALLSAPCLMYSKVLTHVFSGGELKRGCLVVWPGDNEIRSFSDYVYNMVFLMTTYVLPMLAMAVSYVIIGRELWGSRSIGIQTERQLASVKSKRKIVRMFMIVVATFAVFWLPYQVYFVYVYHDSSLKKASYVQHLFMVFYWLAMSYAMVNPLIYFWMNKRFRAYLRRLFRCCLPEHTLECFVPQPQQYYVNGQRGGHGRLSRPASERVKLERTSSTILPSGASPVLLHSGGSDGWTPRTTDSAGARRLLALPSFRQPGGRRSPGEGKAPVTEPGQGGMPGAHWRRRESEASEAFATPETSPTSTRTLTQVRLLMRLAPAPSPALTLALGALGTTPSGGSATGTTAPNAAASADTVAAKAIAEEGRAAAEEEEEEGRGEASRLLTSESCNSLDEPFYDANS